MNNRSKINKNSTLPTLPIIQFNSDGNILFFTLLQDQVWSKRVNEKQKNCEQRVFLIKPEEGYNLRDSDGVKEFNYTLYENEQNVEYPGAMFTDNHVVLVTEKECVCVGTKAKYFNDYQMKPI